MTLEAQVRKLAKAHKPKPLADAIGAVVRKRLAKPKPYKIATMHKMEASASGYTGLSKPRRSPSKRRGRVQAYTPTGKWNATRRGTWTHYMVDTIMAHNDTGSADRAHAATGEYVGKRLDFGWAAKEGYITLI